MLEQYMKHLGFLQEESSTVSQEQMEMKQDDVAKLADIETMNLMKGKMPTWEQMRELQNDFNSWSYFNYYFLSCTVGKCFWVSSIQRHAKLRSLATPSDEAFCLLVLKNGWDLWKWECDNPQVQISNESSRAPNVLFTSKGIGRRTEGYGGWSQEGIALYNRLVEELTLNRINLDKDMEKDIDGIMKSRMELLEMTFFRLAKLWDIKNVLHLSDGTNQKRKRKCDETYINAVQIFGWKDGNC